MKNINKLIINSPYIETQQYWEFIRDTREFFLQVGRRLSGYVVASAAPLFLRQKKKQFSLTKILPCLTTRWNF
jgi:hypothetical protein